MRRVSFAPNVFLIAIAASVFPSSVIAADVFYDIPLTELRITDGKLPKPDTGESTPWAMRYRPSGQPVVALNGPGEVYIALQRMGGIGGSWVPDDVTTARVAIRAPEGKEITGLLGVPPNAATENMMLVKFTVTADTAKDSARRTFFEAKRAYYERLRNWDGAAGTAWFRHQYDEATQQLQKLGGDQARQSVAMNRFRDRIDAFDLFSGGMAIGENLQLDRGLQEQPGKEETNVDVDSLAGITVTAIDWKPLLKDAKPRLDPLAKMIPADQHAVFFPSFAAAMKLADELNGTDPIVLEHMARPQSEDAGVFKKYERQLGISLSVLGRIVGPKLVKSIALTGSDPYFPTGTDVAVLFESDQPEVLAAALKAQILLVPTKQSDAKPTSGVLGGVKYDGVRSPGREICSYVAQLKGAVVVTNSLAQVERLAKVADGMDSIAKLDEYKFFRSRYPLGDADETSFLFLSDPTIRRWCSARWRIASARRIFAAAELAELTAANVEAVESGRVESKSLDSKTPLIDAGEIDLTKNGVVSSKLGSLQFMTPIVELAIQKVTKSEADAYTRWRDQYQSNWRWAFDPIGLRIGIDDKKIAADLTIMPLIAGTNYRELVNISRGAHLAVDAADRHPVLAQTVIAINPHSSTIEDWSKMAANFLPESSGEPFAWLGSWITAYIEDDPLWKELDATLPEKMNEFYRHNAGRLPVAIEIESTDEQKLTAFRDAVRAFLEKIMPNRIVWETPTYRDQPYMRVTLIEQAPQKKDDDPNMALFSASLAGTWILTPSEDLLKRAIDRQLARHNAEKNAEFPDQAGVSPWLGQNLCLKVDYRMLDLLSHTSAGLWGVILGPQPGVDFSMQDRSWANLPILNEWKHLFPSEDAVKVHERLWHTRLVCPGGGQYVWNEKWQTMESTVYGHPGEPKRGPRVASQLLPLADANFGLTFEEQGLRARFELTRETTNK